MIRIMVVDDHTILRQGIAGLIRGIEGFEVVAEAGTGGAAVRLVMDIKPDVVIMDMSLPDMDGIEAVQRMNENGFTGEIVFLTMHNDPGLYEAAAQMGVKGYLLKDDAMDDLLYAIKAVLRGESFTSGSLKEDAPEEHFTVSPLPWRERERERGTGSPLTHREIEIVILIAGGLSSREIAEKLFISVKTVETHRANIMRKLGLGSAAEVVKYAIKSGLVS